MIKIKKVLVGLEPTTLNSSFGRSVAWMVDHNGNSIEVEAHVQAGEDRESQLDEFGLCMFLRYATKYGFQSTYQDAATCVQEEVLGGILEYEEDDEDGQFDVKLYVQDTVTPENVNLYLQALQLPSFKLSIDTIERLYQSRGIEQTAEKSKTALKTLVDRMMMRVRVGGIINTPKGGPDEIYFRIPDVKPDAWYGAIATFIWDNPQFAGYELFIYSETGGSNARVKLEEYNSSKEFLELKASKQTTSHFLQKRLNAAYQKHQAGRSKR